MSFVDLDTEERLTTEFTLARNVITFTSTQLIKNRRYTVTVRAGNIAGFGTSTVLISKLMLWLDILHIVTIISGYNI